MAITGTKLATDPRHYIWWFPGSPVRVHVDLRVIEGLQARVRDAGRGSAEQGLLFGRVFEGSTEILEFQPAFNRSAETLLAEASADSGKRLMGYYRTGEALRLNPDDVRLFETFLGKPYQVFLMMQPNGFAPPNATFFFSRGDQKVSEVPFLEFPLDASQLATEERDRISRYQKANEQPIPAPPLPLDPAKPKKKRLFWKIVLAVFFLAALLLGALWRISPPVREWSTRIWSGISPAPPKPEPPPDLPPLPRPHLGLQAKRQDRDLQLTWDHESPLVAAATSGLISIQDGSLKRDIPLDVQQLRGESILYSPTSDQVLIQLAVTLPTGPVSESVRVIRGVQVSIPVASPKPPEEKTPVAQPSKPFIAPPADRKNTPSTPVLSEPPALKTASENPAPAYPSSSIAAPKLPPPARPIEPVAVAVQPPVTQPQVTQAAPYTPPVPTRKTMPAFPQELRALAVKATIVSIRVTIDKTGKVLKAEPLPGQTAHQLFILEAVHAAELWRFQPARRGDEPIASESILRFNFNR